MAEIVRSFGTVPSLFNKSLVTVACHIHLYKHDLQHLPPNIKSRLIYLLTKRGLVTDDNVSSLLHPQVKKLDLSESSVTDCGLQKISEICKYLYKIDLNSAKENQTLITTKGIEAIAKGCKCLQVVYLRRCVNITDDAVVALATNCRNLRHLNLGGCPLISDNSLTALAENCCSLESLNVSSSKVTDDGINSLCREKCRDTLKELHIASCPGVTDFSIEAVIEFCPKIKILLFHGCPNATDASRVALEQLFERNEGKMKQVTWTIY